MRFSQIPQMSRPAYVVDHMLSGLTKTIADYQNDTASPLNLEPDFQRFHVWTPEQQTSYVEFLLRGGQSSRDLYFNCPGWHSGHPSTFELVDGKQRLEACLGFLNGTVSVFSGLYRGDFTDKPFHVTLRFHINSLQTREEVLRWYLDINSGGVVHSEEELEKVRTLLSEEQERTKHGEG